MELPQVAIFALASFLIASVECQNQTGTDVKNDKYFDFLVYAQVWPISSCIEWEERKDGNTCDIRDGLDSDYNRWTVHGIWPTKDKTMGPFHCSNVKFDEAKIQPILEDLKQHWTNVRKNTETYNFWEHEWTKHGTCAIQLESLNDELKYFQQGLDWNTEYKIGQMLAKHGIKPGDQYRSDDILDAVKKEMGGLNPALECDKMDEFNEPVLTQISICFDKNLKPMGCDNAHGGIYGRCPQYGIVNYPKTTTAVGTSAGISKGTVWGIVIGLLLIAAAAFILYKYYKNRVRNRGYESL